MRFPLQARVLVLAGIFGFIFAFVPACKDDDGGGGGGPTDPNPECEVNHTGVLRMGNESDHSTYNVIVDGVRTCTLGPGEWCSRTVTAGQHSVTFVFANSQNNACNTGFPQVTQCGTYSISCRGDQ